MAILPFDTVADCPGEYRELVGEVNEALCDWVLSVLAVKGFCAKDVVRDDTYFIFSGFPCSVVSFRLSKTWPGWRFGIWLHGDALISDAEDDAKVIQLFCQHDTAIDKFKPSASDLLVEVIRDDVLSMLRDGPITRRDGVVVRPLAERQVQALAKQVSMHPFLSYEGITGYYPIDYHLIARTLGYMASERTRRVNERLSCEFFRRWAAIRVKKANKMPYVTSCELLDYGRHTYPRLEVFCELEDDPTEGALDEMWGLWRLWEGDDKDLGGVTLRVSVYYTVGGTECQLY